ncbi:MAG TPA: DUF309 domain-containing protein, partial [Ignavibacteria bacterium]|nr:DUF309 domain-containing protein [Ignavibacteria bacterium]
MNKQLKLAIEKFNNRKYFECHDILEDYWFECKQDEKDFYQGLLHYAVAFHHLIDKQNPQGAVLQFKKCIERLKKYDKIYKGIEINKIISSS